MKSLFAVLAGVMLYGHVDDQSYTQLLYVYSLGLPPAEGCGFVRQGRFMYPTQVFFLEAEDDTDELPFVTPIFVSSGQ